MKFILRELEQKKREILRNIFLTIPKTVNLIQLEGDFNANFLARDYVAKELIYLPKQVTTVLFNLYHYYGATCQEYGRALYSCVSLLPPWVNTVGFVFLIDVPINDITQNYLAEILKKLPPSVSHLSLSINYSHSFRYRRIKSTLFTSIPETVQSLAIHNLYPCDYLFEELKTALTAVKPHISQLSITNHGLYKIPRDSFADFFKVFPAGLKQLNLTNNRLNKRTVHDLGLFFAKIPASVERLILCGNQLSILSVNNLAQVLGLLALSALDIGENGLMLFGVDDFEILMRGLPKSLLELRVCEKAVLLPKKEIISRLLLIPGHIHTLSFRDSALLALSTNDFVEVLTYLPETIDGLDLSENDLGRRPVAELVYLFSQLPSQITVLKLNHNKLAILGLANLTVILQALPSWISELDVSNNGFDGLLYSQLNKLLTYLPNTVKMLVAGSNEFSLRNDGTVVPYRSLSEVSLFKPQNRFSHQSEFAKLRILMMHTSMIMLRCYFPLEVIEKIFSYTFFNATPKEIEKYIKLSVGHLITSSVPPRQITSAHEHQCLAAVRERINKLKDRDDYLDLSRCGLNRLVSKESQNHLDGYLNRLPRRITVLNLRGNGFLRNGRCQRLFNSLMVKIPPSIECLDLSDNGFEHSNIDELTRLLQPLPSNIKLIFENEEPISKDLQIARRFWPKEYFNYLEKVGNWLELGRELLYGYAYGDTVYSQLIFLHWFRQHVAKAERLIHCIDEGLITNFEDLKFELGQIKLDNAAGSLGRRYTFLLSCQPIPGEEKRLFNDGELVEGIEPISGYLGTFTK